METAHEGYTEKGVGMRSKDSFTPASYNAMLRKAQRAGYSILRIGDIPHKNPGQKRTLILRHDVDVSTYNALRMAKIEQTLGVSSSYYILLHSIFYNPCAPPCFNHIRWMIDHGFELGLHYDVSFYLCNDIDPIEGIKTDVEYLERLFDITIRTVSQHNPTSSKIIKNINAHYFDAYNPKLLKHYHYISDSGFKWRDESLASLIDKEPNIYALIHPTVWAYDRSSVRRNIDLCAKEMLQDIKGEFNAHIMNTYDYLKKRDALDRRWKKINR
jgi:hypothetical protein